MFRLNTLDLKRDRPNADGIVRAWFDGKLVIDRTDVILRSTDFPNMKFNQFLLAPYFGPGLLPHEQTLWIDELAVGTEPPRCRPLAQATSRNGKVTMRVAAAQPRNRTIDFRLKPAEVLAQVDQSLDGTGAARPQGREPPAATRWRSRRTRSACSSGRRRTRRLWTRCSPRP